MRYGHRVVTRQRGELPEPEESLLGIERPTPEKEAETERERLEKIEVRRQFLIFLMEQQHFRDLLWEQLQSFQTFEQPFGISPGGFPDPHATFYKAGMRAAGWHLWTLFDNVAPQLTSLMRREREGMA